MYDEKKNWCSVHPSLYISHIFFERLQYLKKVEKWVFSKKKTPNNLYGGGFWSKVIIMASITSILIKRSHNCIVSEITVSTGIDVSISAADITLRDFTRTDFDSVGTIEVTTGDTVISSVSSHNGNPVK